MAKTRKYQDSDKKQKPIVKKPKQLAPDAKLRKKPVYKSFRLHKSIKHSAPKLPSWWQLLKKSSRLLWANKKSILGFAIIYGLLNLLFVRGLTSPFDIENIEQVLSEALGGESAGLETGFTAFGLLVGASSAGSEITRLYEFIFFILSSLALIWLYRQQQSGNSVTVKMAFYRGMYPLVPFVLVLMVVFLQAIPLIIGNTLYTTLISNDLLFGFTENMLAVLLLLLSALLSLYMMSSSLIALFIVTLPEMTPIIALRQARELVRYRRFAVLRKIGIISLVIIAVVIVLVLPLIFIAPTVAEWLFFAITVFAVPISIGYLFSLYRELL
jgi:hypothetical protein